jgi:glucokinase
LTGSSSSIIGVDLGGTKTALARFDAKTFETLEEERMETHADREFPHVLDDLVCLIEKIKTEDTIAVGIGVPGLVKQPEGNIVRLPNIPGAEGVDLKKQLEDRLKLPVEVDNDANCFALAEARFGSGKNHKVVVGITMGTGVGGGIVVDGKIFGGNQGFAGEVGHMLLKPGEPPFETDDKRGDIEQFFSGTAMGKRCNEAKRPEDYLEGEVCGFLQPAIFREVAWMCTDLVHLLDPSVIVFGGSAGRALEPHLKEINVELKQWVLPGTPLPELAIAVLDDAAIRGAALLVN